MHDVCFFWGITKITKPKNKLDRRLKIKIIKFYARDTVTEIEHPYRVCKDAFFIRIGWRSFLVIGKWEEAKPIEDYSEESYDLLQSAVNSGSKTPFYGNEGT